MTKPNDSAERDLNQIRERQSQVAYEIGQLIDKDPDNPELEKIQNDALRIVREIDEIIKREDTKDLASNRPTADKPHSSILGDSQIGQFFCL